MIWSFQKKKNIDFGPPCGRFRARSVQSRFIEFGRKPRFWDFSKNKTHVCRPQTDQRCQIFIFVFTLQKYGPLRVFWHPRHFCGPSATLPITHEKIPPKHLHPQGKSSIFSQKSVKNHVWGWNLTQEYKVGIKSNFLVIYGPLRVFWHPRHFRGPSGTLDLIRDILSRKTHYGDFSRFKKKIEPFTHL